MFLFRTIRFVPVKNRDTEVGTFPATKILIICLREEQMES